MTAQAFHPAPQRHRVSDAGLWFGLFGAPLAWSIQLLAGYALSAHTCFPEDQLRPATATRPMEQTLLLIAVGGLAVALAAGLTAWSNWRRTRSETDGDSGDLLESGEGRTRFMALAGMLLSGVFALALLFSALPPFLVPACGGPR